MGAGGPGDLFLFIKVKEDSRFMRQGHDLHMLFPIPFSIAALGGEIKVESGVSGAKRITVGMGNLSEDFSKLIKNHVVLTTTEYPDNAPPYTENTTVTPLSTDFDFLVPSTDSNRKPFLLSPDIIYGITFDVLPKTSPAKLLYLYLIKEQGTTYISSDLPHITVDLNKYPVK